MVWVLPDPVWPYAKMVELKPDIECKEKCFDLCHVKNHRLEMTDPAVTLHGRVNDGAGHVVVDEGIVVVGSERLVENVAFPGSIPCKKAKEWNQEFLRLWK